MKPAGRESAGSPSSNEIRLDQLHACRSKETGNIAMEIDLPTLADRRGLAACLDNGHRRELLWDFAPQFDVRFLNPNLIVLHSVRALSLVGA